MAKRTWTRRGILRVGSASMGAAAGWRLVARTELVSHKTPFFVTARAGGASVRAWCGAAAPLVTRCEAGARVQVIDVIDEPHGVGTWYALADEAGAIWGWTQASGWLRPEAG